jgi:hypothetical protein
MSSIYAYSFQDNVTLFYGIMAFKAFFWNQWRRELLNMEKDVDLAKRAKVIEWLKTEIVDGAARLLKAVWEGNQSRIVDALASLISCAYILGRRLGISFRSLDEAIVEKMKKHKGEGHQLEDWYGDISSLDEHISKR